MTQKERNKLFIIYEKLTEMVVELKSLECNNERTPANSRKIALLEIEILSYLKGNI